MFTEQHLLLIFQYLAIIFLAPAVIIFVIDRLISYLSKDAFAVYAATGVVGTPIHELSHATACLLFGMRIMKVKLFSPDRTTGMLGYVHFAYNPSSTLHAVGLVVQGIAPLIGAYAIFLAMPWGPVPDSVLTALNLTDQSPTYMHAVSGAVALLLGNLLDGARGFLWCLVALVIGMHAIPSWSDIRIAGKGMLTLLAVAIGFSALSQIDLSFLPPGIEDAIYTILGLILKGFFWFLEQMTYAVILVTLVAIAGISIFLVLPAMIGKLVRAYKGEQPSAEPTGGQPVVTPPLGQDAILQAIGAMVVHQQAQNHQARHHAPQPGSTTAVPSRRDTNHEST